MSSGVEVAERLQAWLDDVQISARLGAPHYANPGELKADLRSLLERLEAAERKAMLPDLAVCSWCGEFHDGDPDGASDCCMCDLVPYSDLPSIIKDARREVAEEAKTHEAEEAAAEARVAVLEQERDDYLTRLDEVNVSRQQNEVRAVVLREALGDLLYALDRQHFREGYSLNVREAIYRARALALDGTSDSQTVTGDDAERRPSGGGS